MPLVRPRSRLRSSSRSLPKQEEIRVKVEFYNKAEKKKLLKYATPTRLSEFTDRPIEIPTAEFLTYYLFHRKRQNPSVYGGFNAIAAEAEVAAANLEHSIEFSDGSIRTPVAVKEQLTEISEHIGEAIGLSVISRIHNLTEADWTPIPQERGPTAAPTFDFEIASDGSRIIELEAKGSSVADNRLKGAAVSNQKASIRRKKVMLRKAEREAAKSEGKQMSPKLRYGTITAVDRRKQGSVRCLLVDPPTPPTHDDPKVVRLLKRMTFIRNWIAVIAPRSPFAAAISSRVAALSASENPLSLDLVPLLQGNNEPFEFGTFLGFGSRSSFFENRSKVSDGPAGGVVTRFSSQALMLFGVREDLLYLAATQDFEQILGYQAPKGSLEKLVECVVSTKRFEDLRLPDSLNEKVTSRGGYRIFELSGLLHYSGAGLVFGELPLPSE